MTMSELEHGEDDSTVSDEDLFVKRGEDGDLLPVWEEAPGLGKRVKVVPMTYGATQEYFGEEAQMGDISSEDVAGILRNHIIKPNLSDVTSEDVEEKMKPMAPQSLVLAVMKASGVDVDLENLDNEEPLLEGN